jgi:hypothetical protein
MKGTHSLSPRAALLNALDYCLGEKKSVMCKRDLPAQTGAPTPGLLGREWVSIGC